MGHAVSNRNKAETGTGILMTEQTAQGLRDQIVRIVRSEIRGITGDRWVNAAEAAAYLKMSKYHFWRLCRGNRGPRWQGVSPRLKRWRVSELDRWMHCRIAGP
jgi:predicted DNA-binding transcriptional regulator AlpA